MANINKLGSITARCAGCAGALSSFEWAPGGGSPLGNVPSTYEHYVGPQGRMETQSADYRLYRCSGCGRGALAFITYPRGRGFPDEHHRLRDFFPEVTERMELPATVPKGIVFEFREAEKCMDSRCWRAAAGMFRSVLDKTMRANGYKIKPGTTLEQQIDMAAADGVITAARKKKAHEEVRVLGNDVLHDEWREIPEPDVEAARHYCHRILEDLYDDRPSVIALLAEAGRIPDDAPSPA